MARITQNATKIILTFLTLITSISATRMCLNTDGTNSVCPELLARAVNPPKTVTITSTVTVKSTVTFSPTPAPAPPSLSPANIQAPTNYKACRALTEKFTKLDTALWQHQITMAGGGNWEYQAYTNDRRTTYTNAKGLNIRPMLFQNFTGQSPVFVPGNSATPPVSAKMDLTSVDPAQACTSDAFYGCVRDNSQWPNAALPAVISGSIRTRDSVAIKYGHVTIVAKLPRGDYIWPALWLLPVNNAYGEWPTSGEIDIMEARGNVKFAYDAALPGINAFGSTLQFGPPKMNGVSKNDFQYATAGYVQSKPLSDDFHTFELDWTPTYIATFIDGTLVLNQSTLNLFNKGVADGQWDLNAFPKATSDVWTTPGAPFDEKFYLIMNVAVGSMSPGYFGNHPFKDVGDFTKRKAEWLPSWNQTDPDQSSMIIKSVVMDEYVPIGSQCGPSK